MFMIAEERQKNVRQYWLDRFRLGHCGSSFPSDRRRPRAIAHERGRVSLPISPAGWSSFLDHCRRETIEPGHALLGLLQVLLHRYTLAEAIEIGMQGDAGALPVRTDLGGSPSLRDALSRSARAAQEAGDHACSREELQAWACQAGSPPDPILFRVLLSAPELLSAAGEPSPEARAQSDVVLTLRSPAGQSTLQAEYDTGVYREESIEGILRQFLFLMESLDQQLDQPLDTLPLWSAEEALALVQEIAAQSADFPVSQCMHQRFEEQARKTPDAIAVAMPGKAQQQLTYAQLNAAANRLAHYLRSKGAGPDVLVGLYLDRTPDLIVAMLAILKAGAAYLPIDLGYPAERVALILEDAGTPVVLTRSRIAGNLPQTAAEVLCLDQQAGAWAALSEENPPCEARPENLMYSIFTSGSTGRPKGVLISHASVSRLFDATQPWYQFGEQDTWTFFHSAAFDFSVWEIWGALIYGGRLVIVPFEDSRSPQNFYRLLSSEQVTVLNQTPSAFRQLIGVDEANPGCKLDHLRLVIFGGEALNLQSLAPWFGKYGDAQPQLVNMYGITETTVHVTYRPLATSDLTEAPGSVIGRPIPDLQLHVLDRGLQPVPVGVPGEVFVGGAGVARGYLKRDALNAERFIPDPFSGGAGGKLYRTGDLARRLPGGDLEYLGRADQQVKVRGFRIELGEIEAALTRQPSVREALVLAQESGDGEKVLVGYVVPANGEIPGVEKLRRALEATLPGYMVPAKLHFLSQLPLTPHGKVDRAALPALPLQRAGMEQPLRPPENEIEREIVGICREVLRLEEVGIDDNFFDIGGDSLSLAEVHSRLQKLVGREFSIAEMFAHTTVRKLAAWLRDAGHPGDPAKDVWARAQRQRQAMSAARAGRR